MLCFKNGSLPRQEVCDRLCDGSWDKYNDMLSASQSGNEGIMAIYFHEVEILPHAKKGVYMINGEGCTVDVLGPEQEVRAVVEGQFLAKRYHAESFGFQSGIYINDVILLYDKAIYFSYYQLFIYFEIGKKSTLKSV